ncbi:hypothetical protein EMPG_10135 [Blastomyces silverae]|uniref:Uncharacterized protein n=1 Tax=Blastomyces silverae TaxID=2060906 RepID=A0A0H1B4V4_9EURO|nr:hypothetical protein EMPG_10135 [Blastomyces silverae]
MRPVIAILVVVVVVVEYEALESAELAIGSKEYDRTGQHQLRLALIQAAVSFREYQDPTRFVGCLPG